MKFEFEKAAQFRDRIKTLRSTIIDEQAAITRSGRVGTDAA